MLEHDVDARAELEARYHRARGQAHGLIQHAERCHAPRLALHAGAAHRAPQLSSPAA